MKKVLKAAVAWMTVKKLAALVSTGAATALVVKRLRRASAT
ncbi:MAG: hypothetical protein ACRDJO_05830 [Actinomycetota bacterium]